MAPKAEAAAPLAEGTAARDLGPPAQQDGGDQNLPRSGERGNSQSGDVDLTRSHVASAQRRRWQGSGHCSGRSIARGAIGEEGRAEQQLEFPERGVLGEAGRGERQKKTDGRERDCSRTPSVVPPP